jgi:ketosteroid isomerase-like protein
MQSPLVSTEVRFLSMSLDQGMHLLTFDRVKHMQELRYSKTPTNNAGDVQREIAEADRAFCEAVSSGDVERAAENIYTRDATILPPGANMVQGRQDIIEFWKAAASQMSLEAIDLRTIKLTKAGEFLHQIGRATLTLGGQQVDGKYVVIWKQEDGRWKWHVDIWNTNS